MFSENPETLRRAALYVEKMDRVIGQLGGPLVPPPVDTPP